MFFLLHGFSGAPASWDAVVAALPEDAVISRPALYGHAANWRELNISSFDDEVDRLAEIAARYAAPRHLCGYSLGGRLALGLLARHPDLFERATLISAHPGLEFELREQRRESDRQWVRCLRREGIEAFVQEWEALPLWESQRALPAERLQEQRAIRLAHDPEGLAGALEILGLAEMPDFGVTLAAYKGELHYLVGELDDKYIAISHKLRQFCPNLGIKCVNSVGHNLVLEASHDLAAILSESSAKRVAS